jgi:cytochrome P450
MTTAAPYPSLPPGPRSPIPGRVFKELRTNPLGFLTKYAQIHGDIYAFNALGQRYIVLNHPDLIREVLLTQADAFWKGPALQNSKGTLGEGLLTAEGNAHKQQRRLMTPAFHAKHVETYANAVLDCTADTITKLHAQQPQVDIRPHMMRLTLQIAGRALFGTLLEKETELVSHSMETLLANFARSVVPWGKLLMKLPLPSTRKIKKAQADLQGLINQIIAARRDAVQNDPKNQNADLLTTLLAATDPESTVRLTDKQLADQAITILTAGHETTANAMTFTLYLLAKHPTVQSELRTQIQATLGNNPPSPESLNQLPFVRHVLSESMRLYPPVWTVGRQNQRPITLNNFTIPGKCTVLAPQWLLHRDERYFPDPLTFNPARWQNPTHPRYAYFPFSTGPRNCIGEAFAWLEMSLALIQLLQHCTFTLPNDAPEELPLAPSITLRPRGPLFLQITPN